MMSSSSDDEVPPAASPSSPRVLDIPDRPSWFHTKKRGAETGQSQRQLEEEIVDDPPSSDMQGRLYYSFSESIVQEEQEEQEEQQSQSLLATQQESSEPASRSVEEATRRKRHGRVTGISPAASASSTRPISAYFSPAITDCSTPLRSPSPAAASQVEASTSRRGEHESSSLALGLDVSQESMAGSSISERSSQSLSTVASGSGRQGNASRSQQESEEENNPFPWLCPLWTFSGSSTATGPSSQGGASTSYTYLCPVSTCRKGIKVDKSSRSNLKKHLMRLHKNGPWLDRHEKALKSAKNFNEPQPTGSTGASSTREAEVSTATPQERRAMDVATFFVPRNKVASQEELQKLVRIKK